MGTASTVSMTRGDIEKELSDLVNRLGMTVAIAEELAAADVLETEKFRLLRRAHDLLWLLEDD